MRLVVVQHLYAWSYAQTVERVADSLVLRWFCRLYFQRAPDATTLLRWAATIRPETLQALNDRVAVLAQQARVTQGGSSVWIHLCATAIDHPTDSGLLVDGVRVLTRLFRQARPLVQERLAGVRDAFRSRLRTVRRTLQQLHRLRRRPQSAAKKAEQQRAIYSSLLEARSRPCARPSGSAGRSPTRGPPQAARVPAPLGGCRPISTFPSAGAAGHGADTRTGVGRAPVPAREKVLSLFEPQTRIIPRHKGGAAVEFGRQVMLSEVEGGIVTRYQMLADGESDRHQALPAVEHHAQVLGTPTPGDGRPWSPHQRGRGTGAGHGSPPCRHSAVWTHNL